MLTLKSRQLQGLFDMKKLKILLLITICLFCVPVNANQTLSEKKQNRFLLLLSSYKRPMLLSGQILRFMNQTYSNFTLSVSIKGTPQEQIKSTFFKEWQPFINQKRVYIRFDENKEQLSNLLDTARNFDISKYDYFCKIDDDDWYAPTYLEEVNVWLNQEKDIDLSMTRNAILLENGNESVTMRINNSSLAGPTMCFSQKIIKSLFALEKNPRALVPLYPEKEVLKQKAKQEDALIHHMTEKIGKVQYRHTQNENIIYGKQYPSVTRPEE